MSGLRIGIDFGGTKIEAVLMNTAGEVVHRERRSAPRGDYEATLGALCGVVEDLDACAGVRCPVGFSHEGATLLRPAAFGDASGVLGAARLHD